jgi:hypothetical protein
MNIKTETITAPIFKRGEGGGSVLEGHHIGDILYYLKPHKGFYFTL